jgi:hypothetical protein
MGNQEGQDWQCWARERGISSVGRVRGASEVRFDILRPLAVVLSLLPALPGSGRMWYKIERYAALTHSPEPEGDSNIKSRLLVWVCGTADRTL